MHALAFRQEHLRPESPYWPPLVAYFGEEHLLEMVGDEDEQTLLLGGLLPLIAPDGVPNIVCCCLAPIDEALTEAAAMEMRARLGARLPAALTISQESPWVSGQIPTHAYRQGLDLVSAFLGGASPLAILRDENTDPIEALVAGVRQRLSKAAADEVLGFLFDDSSLSAHPHYRALIRDFYADVFAIVRQIIAHDDARRARRRMKAAK